MQLHDRQSVVGTTPTLYIGHRINKDRKTGATKISRKWHAEYNHEGKRFHEPLKTTNKYKAISAAHVICQRLERGEQHTFNDGSSGRSFSKGTSPAWDRACRRRWASTGSI